MKTMTKLAALFATGSLLVAGSVPAFAASPMTDAFVANVRPNVNFLDTSSRLALTSSPSQRIRTFARSEAIEQTITANSLVAWTQTNSVAGEAVALGVIPAGTILGPVVNVAAIPLDVAGNVTGDVANGVGGVLTGRSVALDNPIVLAPVTVTPQPAPQLLPAGANDMSRLSNLQGRQFDALYRATQSDALHQLVTLYTDYINNGDDPALRAMAVSELPKVRHRLMQIQAL